MKRLALAITVISVLNLGCAQMAPKYSYTDTGGDKGAHRWGRSPAADDGTDGKAAPKKNVVGKCGHLSSFTIPSFTAHFVDENGAPWTDGLLPIRVEAGMMKRGPIDIGDHIGEIGFTSVASRSPQPVIAVHEDPSAKGTYVSDPLTIKTNGLICKEYLDGLFLTINNSDDPHHRKDIADDLHIGDTDGQGSVADLNASFDGIKNSLAKTPLTIKRRTAYVAFVTQYSYQAGSEAYIKFTDTSGVDHEGSCSWALTPNELGLLSVSAKDSTHATKVKIYTEALSGSLFCTNVDPI